MFPEYMANFGRIPLSKPQVRFLYMRNIHPHRLHQSLFRPPFPPPNRIRMRPNRLVLLTQKRIGVEFIRMQCPQVIVLDALPSDRVVAADGDLGKDLVRLDGHEDVVWWDLVTRRGCAISEVVEDAFAGVVQSADPGVLFSVFWKVGWRFGACGMGLKCAHGRWSFQGNIRFVGRYNR